MNVISLYLPYILHHCHFQWYGHRDSSNLIHYVRCSDSHIMLERNLFKCFIHLSIFYIIILHYFILPSQQFNAMYLFHFSLIPTFLLLTFFLRVWHFKEPFQSSASWLHPFGTQPKSHFSKRSIEFTTKAELQNMIFYAEDKKRVNKPDSVWLVHVLTLST